jgi:hypothetical protein
MSITSALVPLRRTCRILIMSTLGMATFGCQDADRHRLHGIVTINGTPVQTGEIRLVSPDGSGPTAGAVISEGRYEVIASPGRKRVELQAYAAIGKTRESNDIPGAAKVPIQKPLLPSKFNVDSQEVVELNGDVEKNFAIVLPATPG